MGGMIRDQVVLKWGPISQKRQCHHCFGDCKIFISCGNQPLKGKSPTLQFWGMAG